MENSQTIPILLNLIAAIFGALAQYLYKIGAQRLGLEPLYKIWPFFVGALLFCGITVLFAASFKMGGKLSIVYPVYATTFIWGMLLAKYFGKEAINSFQIAGVSAIILGVVFIALGAQRT